MAAATQICAITELLEIVLLDFNLDARDVLLSQRVSKAFRNVIAGSKPLQRKIFMLADPTPPQHAHSGHGQGQFDPDSYQHHEPKNRGECDQTGDEQAKYRTREINGKLLTLDFSPARVGSVQPWKSYVVAKNEQWRQYLGYARMDWNSGTDVARMNKWRMQYLSRQGWPYRREVRRQQADLDPVINPMLDRLFMSATEVNNRETLSTEESVLRTEASWRKMLTSQPPTSTVPYSSRYSVIEKMWDVTVNGKIETKGGVKAGEVIDDVFEHSGMTRLVQLRVKWRGSLSKAVGRDWQFDESDESAA